MWQYDLMCFRWLSCFMTTDMDATAGQTLYPLHRTKTLHLVCANFVLLLTIIIVVVVMVCIFFVG